MSDCYVETGVSCTFLNYYLFRRYSCEVEFSQALVLNESRIRSLFPQASVFIMATAIKIEFYTEDSESPAFIIEPFWWDTEELINEHSFVTENDHDFPHHYYTVSMEQLRQIHYGQMKNLQANEKIGQAVMIINHITQVISSKTVFEKIRLFIFEWES
jgi:hypothetical protein